MTACVDSGAVRSVAPKIVAPGVSLVETDESKSGKVFRAANGSEIKIYGEKRIPITTVTGRSAQVRYTIADVSRPLLAVCEICDQGKQVVFDNTGSYILDKKTGWWEPIERVGNAYDLTTWVYEDDNSVKAVKPEEERTESGFTWLEELI
jgi:hypothetical protein